jgi:hypothetical protein
VKPLPEQVHKEGLFRPKMTSLVGYLRGQCHLAFRPMRELFKDVFGVNVSTGFLSGQVKKASDSLEMPYQELVELLLQNWLLKMFAIKENILQLSRYCGRDNDICKLSNRLRDWSAEYFRFIETGIPPTNNLAEQTIRIVVLNRRITQGTRRDWGNRFWSISKTCLQQGKNIM